MGKLASWSLAAAVVLTSSPALASSCPESVAAAEAMFENRTERPTVECFGRPCDPEYQGASDLTVLGVKPNWVQKRTRRGALTSVLFELPGSLDKHVGAFNKAYPNLNRCEADDSSCDWVNESKVKDKFIKNLVQVEIMNQYGGTVLLSCNFALSD